MDPTYSDFLLCTQQFYESYTMAIFIYQQRYWKNRMSSTTTGKWKKWVPNEFTILNWKDFFNLTETNKMIVVESIREECLRATHLNKSIVVTSIDAPLYKLYLFFISVKSKGLARTDPINICSFWLLVFFLT